MAQAPYRVRMPGSPRSRVPGAGFVPCCGLVDTRGGNPGDEEAPPPAPLPTAVERGNRLAGSPLHRNGEDVGAADIRAAQRLGVRLSSEPMRHSCGPVAPQA